MQRFGNALLLIVIGACIYIYRDPIIALWTQIYAQYFPCKQPITYSLGLFDTRFGISQERFLKAVRDAEAMWEGVTDKELFTYAPEGSLKVNLVFDYRQEATIKMQELGLSVDDNQASYDALTAKYKALKQEFLERQISYNALVNEIERRSEAYNAEVAEWNKRKGAPRDVSARLNAESASLKREVERIRSVESELRKLQDDINALVTVINQVANNINASAEAFNRIGKARGEEFTEGLYTSDQSGQRIDVYQFNDSEKLVRVLAHELGHALSLEHVEDPKAIMYRLNQGVNTSPTAADISVLKAQCRIE